MQDKLEKLNKILELVRQDTVTPKELEQFLSSVLDFIKKSKDNFDAISSENLKKIQDFLTYMEREHSEIMASVSQETSEIKKELESKIKEVSNLLEEVRTMKQIPPEKGEDGYTPIKGVDYFDGRDGEDGSPDDGEEIVSKINELSIEDDAFKIDASHIKNLPEFASTSPNGGGWRNLYQLHDVEIDTPLDNQVLTYDSTTNTWKNETPSGGGVSEPSTQIVYGTGIGVDSSANFTFDYNNFILDFSDGGNNHFNFDPTTGIAEWSMDTQIYLHATGTNQTSANLDFSNHNITLTTGDGASPLASTYLSIDWGSATINAFTATTLALELNKAAGTYKIGDINGAGNFTYITADDNNSTIQMNASGSLIFSFNRSTSLYEAGDISLSVDGTRLSMDAANGIFFATSGVLHNARVTLDDTTAFITLSTDGNNYLTIDGMNALFSFGDLSAFGNANTLVVDDTANKFVFDNTAHTTSFWMNNAFFATQDPSNFNIRLGSGSGNSLTSATNNLLFGINAGTAITTSSNNTIIGTNAGISLTNSSGSNVFIGDQAGYNQTTGYENIFIGQIAGRANLSGQRSVAIGNSASYQGTSADRYVAIGYAALGSQIGAADNVAIGYAAGTLATGSTNVFIGSSAGYTMTSGQFNVLLGYSATMSTVTASNNFMVGSSFAPIYDVYVGQGDFNASALPITYHGTGGVGTDKVGGDIVLASGQGTGTGTPGKVIIKTSTAGSTGTTLQTLSTRATFDTSNVSFSPYGTSTGNTYESRWLELAANGTNYVGFKSPDALAGNTIYTLPNAFPVSNGLALVSTTAGVMSWSSITSPNGAPMTMSLGNGIQATAGTTSYNTIGAINLNGTEANRQAVIPDAGTIKTLRLVTTTAQPGTGSLVITVRKNGVDTAITLTVAAGAAAGAFADAVNTVAFAAGDLLSFKYVNNAATAGASMQTIGVTFI